MAARYVDPAATGAGNGTSWADAWTTIGAITGLSAGDVVEISGNATGLSRTYNMAAFWNPPSGTAGNPITYRIGQDTAHNGTIIFNYNGATPDADPFVAGSHDIIISGDAGDGGITQAKVPFGQHIQLTGYRRMMTACETNVQIEYVDASAGLYFAVGMGGDQVKGLRIYRCILKGVDLATGDGMMTIGEPAVPAPDVNQIIENYFLLPREIGGGGDAYDGIQAKGGTTVRGNRLEWYEAAYVGFQHGDGWQALGGSYLVFEDNLIVDCPNYALFLEAVGSQGFHEARIVNNQVEYTDPNIAAGTPLAIAIGISNAFSGTDCTNLLVANNTAVNGGVNCFVVTMSNTSFPFVPCTFTGCRIENNLSVDGRGINTTGTTGITVSNNVELTNAQAPSRFVSYVQFGGPTNDMHPTSAATEIVGQGVDLSASFTTDADGDLRTVPWDIGALIFQSTPPPVTGTGILTSSGLLLQSEVPRNILQNT